MSCFFDDAKVLRKQRQNNPFPTTPPKNPRFWEKSGISWEKIKRRRKRGLKCKEKGNIIPLSPQKSLIFSQRWEKSWESWEKVTNKNKKAPPSPTMKKMLLTKATKVTQIYYSQTGT
ncbi:hypothetical protein [Segatella copri]|uniref:hypothetical protein n=1 Tax=Segatella copri TaxID=165179 RepID=UPI0012926085|nr:hypothetical protein [Segatella copri]